MEYAACTNGRVSLHVLVTGSILSSGSSGRVVGANKHEIYAAASSGHLFDDLLLQGLEDGPPGPPSATDFSDVCGFLPKSGFHGTRAVGH